MKTDNALAEELPYWEFFSNPVPHAVLTNGDIVRGATVSLRDIECLDDSEINSFATLLRGALNSLNEGVRVQFCLTVDSDFSESITGHRNLKANQLPRIIDEVSKERLGELETAQISGELYRPKLMVFLQMPMLKPKRQGFFLDVPRNLRASRRPCTRNLWRLSPKTSRAWCRGFVLAGWNARRFQMWNLRLTSIIY